MLHERLDPRTAGDDDGRPDTGWTVTRAGLLDVNPIARLMQAHRPFIDLDGDGLPDPLPDEEQAAPATRMILSLGGLEHGEVWCARDGGDGPEVAAAAVWMPPDASGLAVNLHRMMARELGVPADPAPHDPGLAPLPSILTATSELIAVLRGSSAQRVLIMLADDREGPDRLGLLAQLLAPVIATELAAGREAFAVTLDPGQVTDLTALGFRPVLTAGLGAAELWLGAVHPALKPPLDQPATATV
ncbi:hypothetical protein [Cellulomonas denverensis]|uniref:Uncharacterized protein n=1 Tax=Cellulomonas denverensis TaxID=264297 RepID=A0A7X6KUH7_9CELL|nr:hypothetical protein [Cellulomonas denverensis]NKY22551.1 hypothetical protein [Cellulomonas denverensis]GIG24804.1 hypothetical protein Cde04nite_10480 [Cellulomonas denverensis]